MTFTWGKYQETSLDMWICLSATNESPFSSINRAFVHNYFNNTNQPFIQRWHIAHDYIISSLTIDYKTLLESSLPWHFTCQHSIHWVGWMQCLYSYFPFICFTPVNKMDLTHVSSPGSSSEIRKMELFGQAGAKALFLTKASITLGRAGISNKR